MPNCPTTTKGVLEDRKRLEKMEDTIYDHTTKLDAQSVKLMKSNESLLLKFDTVAEKFVAAEATYTKTVEKNDKMLASIADKIAKKLSSKPLLRLRDKVQSMRACFPSLRSSIKNERLLGPPSNKRTQRLASAARRLSAADKLFHAKYNW